MKQPKVVTNLEIEYAYPTRTNAEHYGMARTGCYYVTAENPRGRLRPRVKFSPMGFRTKEECKAYMNKMERK